MGVVPCGPSSAASSLSRASEIEEEVYEAMRGSGLLAELDDEEEDLGEPEDDDDDEDDDDENDEENEDDYEDVSTPHAVYFCRESGVLPFAAM